MNKEDLVSILTVNYNGYKDTRDLITSLKKYEVFPYELIIVDNGSKVDEAALLKKEYPETVIIRSEKNLGFAGGNNLGLPYVKGNYILYLNNDILIEAPFLERMVNRFRQNPSVGIVSPKIRYASSKETIQYAGFAPLSRIALRNYIIGTGETDRGQYDQPCSTSYAHGACMMTTREVLDKVGVMSEVFFLFYEELDWSQRVKNAGYIILYEPTAVVYHKEGMSINKGTPLRNYYLVRGRLLYARRNCKGPECILSCLYQISTASLKGITALLKGKIKMSNSYFKATWDGCIGKSK